MAQLDFEIGDPHAPRGHALLYFRGATDSQSVFATYVIVPPITFDLSKYIPPMVAARIPHVDPESVQFVPLPPIPEAVESLQYLRNLAEARGDDLVFGGAINQAELEASMTVVADLSREYANRCRDRFARTTSDVGGLDVEEVVYSLMAERDKLSELARLLGKLRYAMDGKDKRLTQEVVQEMEVLGKFLPEKYRVSALIRAAQLPGEKGDKLAELYLNRCYRICSEDYKDLDQIDRSIEALEAEAQ